MILANHRILDNSQGPVDYSKACSASAGLAYTGMTIEVNSMPFLNPINYSIFDKISQRNFLFCGSLCIYYIFFAIRQIQDHINPRRLFYF